MLGSNSPSGNVTPQSTISATAGHLPARSRRGRRSCQSRRGRQAPGTPAHPATAAVGRGLCARSAFAVLLDVVCSSERDVAKPDALFVSSAPAINSAPSHRARRPALISPARRLDAERLEFVPACSSQAAAARRSKPAPRPHLKPRIHRIRQEPQCLLRRKDDPVRRQHCRLAAKLRRRRRED